MAEREEPAHGEESRTGLAGAPARRSRPARPSRPARGEPPALAPLREGERPAALVVATAICGLLALAVIVGALTIHGLSRHGGSLPAGLFIGGVLALLAVGMHRRRYWAVLSFQALLTFQILVTSLALVVSSTITAAAGCLLSIALAGWLFWKLVRVMGRIQAAERERPL
jgi:hypothetical protein